MKDILVGLIATFTAGLIVALFILAMEAMGFDTQTSLRENTIATEKCETTCQNYNATVIKKECYCETENGKYEVIK